MDREGNGRGLFFGFFFLGLLREVVDGAEVLGVGAFLKDGKDDFGFERAASMV